MVHNCLGRPFALVSSTMSLSLCWICICLFWSPRQCQASGSNFRRLDYEPARPRNTRPLAVTSTWTGAGQAPKHVPDFGYGILRTSCPLQPQQNTCISTPRDSEQKLWLKFGEVSAPFMHAFAMRSLHASKPPNPPKTLCIGFANLPTALLEGVQ